MSSDIKVGASADISEGVSVRMRTMSFLCACLVPLIHMTTLGGGSIPRGSLSWLVYNLVHHGIAMMAVPWFFLAAGYFLAHHNLTGVGYWREVRKRLYSLVLPMIIWGTLWWAFRWRFDQSWLKCICICWGLPKYGPLWFVRTLFLLVLISPCIYRLRRNVPVMVGLFLVNVLWPLFVSTGEVYQMLRYFISPEGFFYMLIGMHLADRPLLPEQGRGGLPLSLGIGILVLKIIVTPCEGVMIALNSCAVPFLLYGVYLLISDKRLPFKMSAGINMIMYLSHEFIIFVVVSVAGKFGIGNASFLFYVTASIFVVMSAYAFALILSKMTPSLAKWLCGGR